MMQKIPMRRAALLALALLFTIPFVSACSQSAATIPAIADPETKRGNVVDKPFGQTIADPYRWLEKTFAAIRRSLPGLKRRTRSPLSRYATEPRRFSQKPNVIVRLRTRHHAAQAWQPMFLHAQIRFGKSTTALCSRRRERQRACSDRSKSLVVRWR